MLNIFAFLGLPVQYAMAILGRTIGTQTLVALIIHYFLY